jgi:CheY-like chemotaxis protein
MNSILVSPRRRGLEPGQILVIESDPERSKMLERILRGQVHAHLEIVRSMDQAIRSMTTKLPDLVLTSPLLKPVDEATLSGYLKRTPTATHVQVITVPHSLEVDDDSTRAESKRVLGFLRRRSTGASACAPGTLRNQIEAYLEQARAARTRPPVLTLVSMAAMSDESQSELSLIRQPSASEIRTSAAQTSAAMQSVVRRPHLLGGHQVNDRRRARRRPASELPGLWAIRLPLGPDAKVVDISSSGALVETSFKITSGSTMDLQVLGQNINLRMPARMVRSEVASVDRLGVRYRAAAAFSEELDILELHTVPSDPSAVPKVLTDMVARVLAEAGGNSSRSSLRTRFEQELRRLLPVKEIKIRQTPMIPSERTESVYFTVPRASSSRPILQAVFEPDYQPSATEFRILKAAAGVAAVILEFAPFGEEAQTPAVELAG